MGSMLQDVRFGARMLLKHPAVTFIAVLALALGIGLTTTMFSIVNGAVRGLPFDDAERLMHLERNNLAEGIESMEVTLHDYVDWRSQHTSFEDLAAFYQGTVNVSGTEGRPTRYRGAFMTPATFRLIGVSALLGRTFREDEAAPDAQPVMLLGYRAWQDRFNGDQGIIGRTVRTNGEVTTVVGVMPEGFAFPIAEEVWVPYRRNPLEIRRGEGTTLEVFGKLKAGVSLDQAHAEFTAIAHRLALEYPETNEGVGVVIKPFVEEYVGQEARALLFTMLGAVFGVLLIACANVANLLLARAVVRTKEVAIRSALGASRGRVISQLLAEALVLCVVGAVLGIGLAQIGIGLFNDAIVDTNPPFWIDIRIDPTVVLFVLGITAAASLIAGTFPALQASRADVNTILKDESRGSSSLRMGRFSKGLVIAEMALSCGLLAAAGLMTKSIVNLKNMDYGFPADEIFTARVGLFEGDYPDAEDRLRFYDELLARLRVLPGVTAASLVTSLPTSGGNRPDFAIEGAAYATDRDYPEAQRVLITPGFFETFKVTLAQGRDFSVQDQRDNLPVALVNRSFVTRFFPDGDVIGRRIRFGRSDSEEEWRTIVGIAPDLWMTYLGDTEGQEGVYVPLAQSDANFISIAIRTPGSPMALTSQVRDAVAGINPNLPIYWAYPMNEVITNNGWHYQVFGSLFVVFGIVALFLASVGLYGVMAFSVSRRTQEVGLRMALGARAADVLRLIFRQGMTQVGAGLIIGLALAAGLARMLDIVLFEVQPWDPAVFAAIVVSLLATGVLACLVPATRATRVDPIVALRYE